MTKTNKVYVVFTDGYELKMTPYDSREKAVETMKKEYRDAYLPQCDENCESYCDENNALVVIDGEERFIWRILIP